MTGLSGRRAEFTRRLDELRALMDERGAAACLLEQRRNFAWLTAGGVNHVVLASEAGAAPLLVTRDAAAVLAPINEAARLADEELAGLDVEVASLDWFDASAPAAEIARRAPGPVARDADLEDALVRLRSILSPFDADRVAWLGALVRDVLAQALGTVVAGMAEDAVMASALAALATEGVRAPVCLAAADERIERYRHPLPGATRVDRRIMVVLVAERWGLHVAATRFLELEPPGPDLARRLEATAAVQRAMHEATVAGSTLGEVLDAARGAYARTGFPDEWRLHHQGGTIAYQGRERIAVPGDRTRIEPGMAFAWNPSITGAKAEETFLLAQDGSRRVVTA